MNDTLKLPESETWINYQARDERGNHVLDSKTNTPVKNRKVRYFDGWVYFKRVGKHAQKTYTTFSSRRNLRPHTKGQTMPILFDGGTESPYLLQLSQLAYQHTKTLILKCALIDETTNMRMTDIRANTDATRIRINLGWFQANRTQRFDTLNFGVDNTVNPKPS